MEEHRPCSSLQECCISAQGIMSSHSIVRTNRPSKQQCIIKGKVIVDHSPGQSAPGKSAFIRIYTRTKADPNTGKGELSEKAYLKHGKSNQHGGTKTTTYQIKLRVEPEFGIPGAFLIENRHKHKFFLHSATFSTPENNLPIHFDCRSWVYPIKVTQTHRIFFSNTSYLPSQTPSALVELRNEELASLRGDDTGERKEWDRIYDYDYYNDLGNPDKSWAHIRPVLGGSESRPYPRRGRTGRPRSKEDPLTESRPEGINLNIYVPPDERFSPKKLNEFIGNAIKATVHFLIAEGNSLLNQETGNFKSFDEIHDLFSSNRSQTVQDWVTEKLKKLVPGGIFKEIARASKEDPTKFLLPEIVAENELAWKDDEEFGRQMLAGVNPMLIRSLEVFPPQSKNGDKSSIKASDIEHNLDSLTLIEAMNQWRIFILDHHDYLMPFLRRINTKGIRAYASRTLLFLRADATLKPLAIELSLPGEERNRVFLPASHGTEAALWQLAKAHVAANDSGYHQLISHWLHTHAVVEPFIIATRRQLSVMHPIHKLLDPHFKDTMHINALARSILINSGGILEKTLFTGKFSMELSSKLYKEWRFDEQALPMDLLKRRMALEDPEEHTGVQILFQDYPYGYDGLEIWSAINTWVTDYCSLFYKDDNCVASDSEIQQWWSEIRNVGHGDKCNETWWYEMTTLSNLIRALTTLIWIASGLHAAVNFGQYAYAGYPPNRPTLCQKFILKEGTFEFAEFLRDPDQYYLRMLPEKIETTLSIALMEVLSQHTSDEEFLGQRSSPEWTDSDKVKQKFEMFNENLRQIEKNISERNSNGQLKNRWGPAKIPYKLLIPDSSNGGTRKGIRREGIPNSVSI